MPVEPLTVKKKKKNKITFYLTTALDVIDYHQSLSSIHNITHKVMFISRLYAYIIIRGWLTGTCGMLRSVNLNTKYTLF
jgi:hypothetical protein